MKTNGSTPKLLSDEQIIREAVYHAAVAGHYDTSESAQRSNMLTVDAFNMGSMERLPTNATHKFFIMVDATAYMVMRLKSGEYQVTEHDQGERHRQERLLRTAVLDFALWYLQGEGAGYHPSQGPEARAAAIKELLEEGKEYEEQERAEEDTHPIIREERPDIYLAPGDADSPTPRVQRQWSVSIGPHNHCRIGLIGYDTDNRPELIGTDAEPEE